MIEYEKSLLDKLDTIRRYFQRVIRDFEFGDYVNSYIETIFNYYEKVIKSCKYDYELLKEAHRIIFTNMSYESIDATNKECIGFTCAKA